MGHPPGHRPVRPARLRLHRAGRPQLALPVVGPVHAGRRTGRPRRGGAVFYGPHPHSERLPVRAPGSDDRRSRGAVRAGRRRRHGPPERPVALAAHRGRAGRAVHVVARGPHDHRRVRRCHPQSRGVPARRRGPGGDLRRLAHPVAGQPHAGGEPGVLQPAPQVQDRHHRLPAVVLVPRDQRHWSDGDRAPGHRGDRVQRARRRGSLDAPPLRCPAPRIRPVVPGAGGRAGDYRDLPRQRRAARTSRQGPAQVSLCRSRVDRGDVPGRAHAPDRLRPGSRRP